VTNYGGARPVAPSIGPSVRRRPIAHHAASATPPEAAEEGSEKASQEAPGYPYTGNTKWSFLSNENKILQSTPTPLFLPLSTSSAEAIAGQEPFGSSRGYGSASCGVRSGSHDPRPSHPDCSCVRASPCAVPLQGGLGWPRLRQVALHGRRGGRALSAASRQSCRTTG